MRYLYIYKDIDSFYDHYWSPFFASREFYDDYNIKQPHILRKIICEYE